MIKPTVHPAEVSLQIVNGLPIGPLLQWNVSQGPQLAVPFEFLYSVCQTYLKYGFINMVSPSNNNYSYLQRSLSYTLKVALSLYSWFQDYERSLWHSFQMNRHAYLGHQTFLLNSTQWNFRHSANWENIINDELNFLTTVHKLTVMHAFSSTEQFYSLLKLIWIAESY